MNYSIDPHSKATVGRYDPATRRRVRRKLAERKGEFRLGEYLDALEQGISRGQAQADLQGDPDFVVTGHGRGARWSLQ